MNFSSLHWTIGPVQSFVAQSRQTRDLLVSSFLLSYLTGVAMDAVIQLGGRIIFPTIYVSKHSDEVSHELILAIQGKRTGQSALWMGTLPNRFKAAIPKCSERDIPVKVTEAVKKRWNQITEAVWKYLQNRVGSVESFEERERWKRPEVKEIWDRQVNGFWEIAWGVSDRDDILDRRKNWRNHISPIEKGAKCTLMSEWQEISGYDDGTEEQKRFWETLDQSVNPDDLTEKERLCAIALVKRFFPYVAEESIGWEFPEVAKQLPSVLSIAAVPWLQAVNRSLQGKNGQESAQAVEKYVQTVTSYNRKDVELSHHFDDVRAFTPTAQKLTKLDGKFHLEYALDTFLEKGAFKSSKRESIKKAYNHLCEKVKAKPAPYFALLIMDGDRLGALLQSEESSRVSRALDSFSKQIHSIVKEHLGVVIYAGGDDAMAMLPMEQAVQCAKRLHDAYVQAFEQHLGNKATSSTGIVFAHCQSPLQSVLQFGRHLLDEIAKEACGRDSLAIGVWKRAGAEIVWSAPWERDDQLGKSAVEELLFMLQPQATVNDQELPLKEIFTNSFLNKFRNLERFPFYPEDLLKRKELMKKVVAEELNRIRRGKWDLVTRMQLAESMLNICYQSYRDEQGKVHLAAGEYSSDGAQLIKFIREQGGELS
ncbi:type III-B CRISPR-associated protein Cas10/Cmr2 [Thermoflavimicrobium dichotomicum]|uniref:CRISPR-associated protein Cmr2 n=1 Tax=Thermoflavimicrobium dichotomicum TaxID=46223 RepID=A0A1I3T7F9_9BACL|nr:type III-B CRISPR-associated protein Cas10/Cmr2 [Thermoflavimicrobium dichotomicum]SFJ66219.1 CRISPR-associated protein Cmr2 [Thermoflavimicrobium dichotomicum]